MTRGHTKRKINKSRSKQRVSRKRTKRRTRKQRGGSIAMASKTILPLGVLVAAYLLYNRNSNSNSDRDVNMDIEALSKNLGLTEFDQSFTQDAEAEFEEMNKHMSGGNGNNKDDFDSLCNILEIARKWKHEGRSTETIKGAVKKLKEKITILRKRGATKEQVFSEIDKCIVGHSSKGGKRKQRGGFMGINDLLLGAIAVALGAGYATRNKSLKRNKSRKPNKSMKREISVWGDL